jgi:membrane protein involved in colicin uptake
MLNAYGHMVPATPENEAKREKEVAALAKQEARDKAAAEKAEKKRLAACARRGIPDAECAPETVVTVGTSG